MLVVCPFTEIQSATSDALDASGFAWEARYVGDSDESYWALLSELWAGDEDLAIVEHDIVIAPETLREFDECPSVWCSAPYPYFVGLYAGLGCTRLRARVRRVVPNILDEVARMSNSQHTPKHWCVLDGFLQAQMRTYGFTPHLHAPVEHLGDLRPSHGCQ